MKVIALLLISIFPSMGFAEGPPVDEDGKVFVDHVVLHLTDDQMELIETKRLVEFTPSQHKSLKALNPSVPSVIPVIGSSYNNCTCELLLYGIWNNQGQIAIPLFLFGGDETWIKYAPIFDKQITAWGSDFFVIDTKANIYWQGRRVAKKDVIQIAKQTGSIAFMDRPLMQSPQVAAKVEHLLKFLVKEGKKSKVQISY